MKRKSLPPSPHQEPPGLLKFTLPPEALKVLPGFMAENPNFVIDVGSSLVAQLNAGRERQQFIKKPDDEKNAALIRLREEMLPNGKLRTYKEVRAELRKINPSWVYTNDDAVREQYSRLKSRG